MEHVEPLHELFKACGVYGEELSLFGFEFGLMVGNFYYLSIGLPDNNNNRDEIFDEIISLYLLLYALLSTGDFA